MLARHLMLADDVLHDHEAEIERLILREVDLSDFPPEVRPLEELLAEIGGVEPMAQRNSVYVELVGIALVDQELHPSEALFLERVREKLSIPAETARRLQEFAERFHVLAAEGRMLVFESPGADSAT
jgi:hypothetical protein